MKIEDAHGFSKLRVELMRFLLGLDRPDIIQFDASASIRIKREKKYAEISGIQ